jgi:predicted Zn finger-like uncharacterized protein
MLETGFRLKLMGIRCDRCQTECKVDDSSAGQSSREIQCSACGHVMIIGPKTPAPLPSSPGPGTPKPEANEWVVETVHGRRLQTGEIAALHRWIIERRVTRDDRISCNGQPFQPMAEVAELLPFFDITDSAERARRADTPSPKVLPAPPPATAQPPTTGETTAGGPTPARADVLPADDDRTETKVVPSPTLRLALPFKLALMTLTAAAVAYAGIALYNLRWRRPAQAPFQTRSVTSERIVAPAPAPAPTAPEVVTIPASPDPQEPAIEPSAEEEDESAAEPTPRRKARAAGRSAGARGSRSRAAAVARRSAAGNDKAGPASPQAMAAQGYAALNRRQFPQAIRLFKQALAGNPANGTAQFGLAEAYRETGQRTSALKAYRRYIQILPSGPDAGSARLQIRLLERKQ